MATIKEIAKETGFSPSTVSIVLRGKSVVRSISEKTTEEILEAAHRLGYRANLAARRLRANQGSRVTISVFMALDIRANFMVRFLLGLQSIEAEHEQPFDLVIHSYKSDSLYLLADTIALTHCAIICNASEEDMSFLDRAQYAIPIVLFMRESTTYCTVGMAHRQIATMAADILARRGHKTVVLINTDSFFHVMKQTVDEFHKAANRKGLAVTGMNGDYSMRGGHSIGMAIAKMEPLPDCVLNLYNRMAVGVLRALRDEGVKVPEQIELISIGSDSSEYEEFAGVSISTLHLPLDKMAEECVRLLFLQLDGKLTVPCAVEVPVIYVARETCGE